MSIMDNDTRDIIVKIIIFIIGLFIKSPAGIVSGIIGRLKGRDESK